LFYTLNYYYSADIVPEQICFLLHMYLHINNKKLENLNNILHKKILEWKKFNNKILSFNHI